jgi:phosphoglycolate phosphatase
MNSCEFNDPFVSPLTTHHSPLTSLMHVCLFDIDGTLLNTGGAGQAAMERALAAEFQAERPLHGILTAGRTDRAIVADLFAHFGVEPTEARWARLLAAYLRHLPDHLRNRSGLVLPGIVPLLEELHRRDDVLLGLLTGNFREGARLKLEHFQIHGYFAFGGFGDEHHHRDDVASLALLEAERFHGGTLLRERVWVIGDTPADVQCARAIGANAVAVATGIYPRAELEATSPDHLFDDFSDPAGLLSLLESGG